jgi:NADPH:quinone reductase-like Zn-dependent oxidoreductase
VVLPHVPGLDVAGTIDALGPRVDGLEIGQAVVGFLPMSADGAAAEYVLAPAEVLATAPSSIPLADAAALPLVALTAWQALFEHAELAAGQRLLVSGAGGAVGGYAVQLAKAAGAHVIATASPRSEARVRAAGADEVVDHTTTDLTSAVTEPVDVLLNLAPIDPEQLTALLALVASGGAVVSTTAWMPTPSDDERGVRGSTVFVRSDAEQLSQLVARVDRGELRVDVAERVPLDDLPALHARAASGAISGKVIVLPHREG